MTKRTRRAPNRPCLLLTKYASTSQTRRKVHIAVSFGSGMLQRLEPDRPRGIVRLKASGCCGLLGGDDFGHHPVIVEGPAFAGRHVASGGGLLGHSPAPCAGKAITASRGWEQAPQL